MSLFQNLLETYERCKDAAGIKADTQGEINEKKTFLPLYHTTFKSQMTVVLDGQGGFLDAKRDRKEATIVIPCTEKSAGRTSGIEPHPLCDQLGYVGGIDEKKKSAYLAVLKAWELRMVGGPKEKLQAVYTYVDAGTMISDLESKELFKDSEYDQKDATRELNQGKIQKIGVRFVVRIPEDPVERLWEDPALRQGWIDYIRPKGGKQAEGLFDYMSGTALEKAAEQHPKNINAASGNARLLSGNDISGLTFRGRFSKPEEALIVDMEQSQKMHQTLRWLINQYGYHTGSQVIVVWAVDANTSPPVAPQKNSYDMLWSGMAQVKTDREKRSDAELEVYGEYSKKLRNLFQGFGNADSMKTHARTICIAVFDAATTGRLSLTFYQELPQDRYLENIAAWHEETSYELIAWERVADEKGKEKSIPHPYIGAPSYDDILFAVYGKPRGGNDAGYNTLKKKVRKQLLECMFGNFAFPKSMVDMAMVRASRPMSFTDTNGKFSSDDWERSIQITCALARKYDKQQKKEEIQLGLDETRKDRDYLYGRLLAVADRIERRALYKANKQDVRATNAVRLMSAFAVKPYHTWGILYRQLIPYINQLYGAGYEQSVVDEIMDLLAEDYEDNRPLSPLYLLGFSAQRKAFEKMKYKQENSEVDENGNTEQN